MKERKKMQFYNEYFVNPVHCQEDFASRRPNAVKDGQHYRKVYHGITDRQKVFLDIMSVVKARWEAYYSGRSWKATYLKEVNNAASNLTTDKYFLWPARVGEPDGGYDNIIFKVGSDPDTYRKRTLDRQNFEIDFLLDALRFLTKGMSQNQAQMYSKTVLAIAVQESSVSDYVSLNDERIEYGMLTISPVQDGEMHNGYESLYDPKAMISAFTTRMVGNLDLFKKQLIDPDAVLVAQLVDFAQGNAIGGPAWLGNRMKEWKQNNPSSLFTKEDIMSWIDEGVAKKKLVKAYTFIYKTTIPRMFGISPWPSSEVKATKISKQIDDEIKSGKSGDGTLVGPENTPEAVGTPRVDDKPSTNSCGLGNCQNYKPWI